MNRRSPISIQAWTCKNITNIIRGKTIKSGVFICCLLPLAWLVWLAGTDGPGGTALGPNPQEYINRYLGDWALRILLLALAITPVRLLSGWWVSSRAWSAPMRYRRMIGLYAFFYACLHVTSYVVLDQTFNWAEIWGDILKRNYITVGMVSLVLLIALAVTSPKAMVRKLGGRRWRNLHRMVYLAAPLVCLHFFMMRKGIQIEPLIYSAITTALLGVRLGNWLHARARRSASSL